MSKKAKQAKNPAPAPVSRDVVMWAKPVEVSDLDMAFPASVIGKFLPPMKDIPDELYQHHNKWYQKSRELFFKGGTIDLKPEIDRTAAFRQLKACLGSFEPKHEHKESGVAYLLSLWCNSPT